MKEGGGDSSNGRKKSPIWTIEENRLFEMVVTDMNPSSMNFFDALTAIVPTKDRDQIINHFRDLVMDLNMIENGQIDLPVYESVDNYQPHVPQYSLLLPQLQLVPFVQPQTIHNDQHQVQLQAVQSAQPHAQLEGVQSGQHDLQLHAIQSGQLQAQLEAVESGQPHAQLETTQSGKPHRQPEAEQSRQSHVQLQALQSGQTHAQPEAVQCDQPKTQPKAIQSGQPHPQPEAIQGGQPHAQLQAVQTEKKQPGRKGVIWTRQEHEQFLQGLRIYGKGNWRNISRNCVKTRTPAQVASHSQKYFLKISNTRHKNRQLPYESFNFGQSSSSFMEACSPKMLPNPDASNFAMQATNFAQENQGVPSFTLQPNMEAPIFNKHSSGFKQANWEPTMQGCHPNMQENKEAPIFNMQAPVFVHENQQLSNFTLHGSYPNMEVNTEASTVHMQASGFKEANQQPSNSYLQALNSNMQLGNNGTSNINMQGNNGTSNISMQVSNIADHGASNFIVEAREWGSSGSHDLYFTRRQ